MKSFLLVTCLFICLSACKKPKDIGFLDADEICNGVDSLLPPADFNLIERVNLDLNMSLVQCQFVTENVGYVLTSLNVGGYVGMVKTEDKGLSWMDLSIRIPVYPRSMSFKNEKEGFVTVQDTRGCPTNCAKKAVILKTTDGGLTWTEIQYPNLVGMLHHLKFDNDGNAFAMLADYDNSNYSLVKSTDNCATWTVIYTSSNLYFQSIDFSYTVSGDKLYALGKNGTILKIDKKGQLMATLTTGQTQVSDLRIVNENVLIAQVPKGLIKSTDGGATWQSITTKHAEIIDFPTENEGLILLNKNSCNTDFPQSTDVFAYTKDGGLTWQEGRKCRNLVLHYRNAQTGFSDKYLFLMGTKIIELKKK
jgi:photosystem II stability/assembly factor-like uncharacterized protein